ncbi:MAG: T9SS type A sorting domain-containing protein [Syntrophothermus sp.]
MKRLMIFLLLVLASNIYSQIGVLKRGSIFFLDKNIGWYDEFRTTDGGDTWNHIDSAFYNILFINDSVGFAKTWGFGNPQSLYKTINRGESWNYISSYNLQEFYFFDEKKGYGIITVETGNLDLDGGYFCTTSNGGSTWDTISFIHPYARDLYLKEGNIFSLSTGGVYKSIDSGHTWEKKLTSPFGEGDNGESAGSIIFMDLKKGYVTFYEVQSEPILYKTTDGGENWINENDKRIKNGSVINFKDSIGQLINSEVLYRTTNKGETWDSLYYFDFFVYSGHLERLTFIDGFNGYAVIHHPSDQSKTFCKTTDGGYTWDCSPMNLILGNNDKLHFNKYSLEQNYPNPFNPSTIINYTIANSGIVKLVVYDIIGREVATLVNEYQSSGAYNIEFNATDLNSGVYFYRIDSGGYSKVKKMMVLK